MSFARATFKGLASMSSVVLVTKCGGLLAQWVAGLILVPDQFAVVALFSVAQMVISGLKDLGINQYLVIHGGRFDEIVSPVKGYVFWSNVVTVAVLLCLGPLLAWLYAAPLLLWMTLLLAGAVPFTSYSAIHKARLAIDLHFGQIARAEAVLALTNVATLIALLAVGVGVVSYPLALLAAAATGLWRYRSLTGGRWPTEYHDWVRFREILRQTKWLVLGSYAINLSLRGDYFVLGFVLTKWQLGAYFFGFQLTASVIQLIGTAINAVMMPSFSRLKEDPTRLRRALDESLTGLAFVSGLMCLGMLAWLGYAIQILWGGKWADAYPIAVIITLTLPIRMLATPLGASVLEGIGAWRSKTLYICFDGLCVVGTAYLGGRLGGIEGAAWGMTVQRATIGYGLFFITYGKLSLGLAKALRDSLLLNLPFLAAAGLGFSFNVIDVHSWISPTPRGVALFAGNIAFFILSFLVLHRRSLSAFTDRFHLAPRELIEGGCRSRDA